MYIRTYNIYIYIYTHKRMTCRVEAPNGIPVFSWYVVYVSAAHAAFNCLSESLGAAVGMAPGDASEVRSQTLPRPDAWRQAAQLSHGLQA